MILSIDMVSETPIYTQLSQQVIRAIAVGDLKAGDDLPSVRSLAADIGVNLHTVNKAYNFLKTEGFLVVTRRKGVMVNEPEAYAFDDTYMKLLSAGLENMLSEAAARGVSDDNIETMVRKILSEVRGD